MSKVALVFPLAAGKTDTEARSISDMFAADPGAYWESRDRHGVTLERAYLQTTPMGSFVVAYIESAKDFATTIVGTLESDLDFDRKFIEMVKELHGVDLTQPPQGPDPEVLADWVNADDATRSRGMAFTAPVAPGKTEAGRAFADEAFHRRVAEFADSRREFSQRAELITLQPTPMGDVLNVYIEGTDPWAANERFANSQRPYDVWFKAELTKIFPDFVDFSVPVAGVIEIFDSETVPRP